MEKINEKSNFKKVVLVSAGALSIYTVARVVYYVGTINGIARTLEVIGRINTSELANATGEIGKTVSTIL